VWSSTASKKQLSGASGQVFQNKSSLSADNKSEPNNNNNNNSNSSKPKKSKAANTVWREKSTGSNPPTIEIRERPGPINLDKAINTVLNERDTNKQRELENKYKLLAADIRTLQSGRNLSSRGSLLTTNLVKFAQQVVNPQPTVEIQPLPGAPCKSYLKSVWQPFRQVNLSGGKASICLAPHCTVPLWVSISTDIEITGADGLKEFKLHRVNVDASKRSVLEIDTIVNNQFVRAAATCTDIPNSFILRGEANKEGGFVANFPHQGTFHYFDIQGQQWYDVAVERGGNYWFGFHGTQAPISVDVIATLDVALRELTGMWFESNDLEATTDTVVFTFPIVEQGDINWSTALTFSHGERCFKGFANSSIYNNPVLNRHLVAASSILLTNDAPALYSGGELIQARITTYPLPRLTDTDIATWVSSQSTYGYAGKLKDGGYQYHVPSADITINQVTPKCPFISLDTTYWMCIDYSVIINGQNPPTVIPMHMVHTEIFGYGGVENVVAPSSQSVDIGFGYMLSSMFTGYKPLKNGDHLKELVNFSKSVFDDMVDYGKRIINTKVPIGLVEQLVTKGVPIALDLGEVLGTFLAEAL
jgi:hypothetical protein